MKKGYELVVRSEFIEERYKRFKESMLMWEKEAGGIPSWVYITDLDSTEPDGTKVKDLVLCDSCNGNITDYSFLMFEKSLVYHKKCRPEIDVENVLPMGRGKKCFPKQK